MVIKLNRAIHMTGISYALLLRTRLGISFRTGRSTQLTQNHINHTKGIQRSIYVRYICAHSNKPSFSPPSIMGLKNRGKKSKRGEWKEGHKEIEKKNWGLIRHHSFSDKALPTPRFPALLFYPGQTHPSTGPTCTATPQYISLAAYPPPPQLGHPIPHGTISPLPLPPPTFAE